MRHQKKLKKLGLKKSHRKSLLRNLAASLILSEHLKTTESKAKALAAYFDRMMRIVRKRTPREAIRLLAAYCPHKTASIKLLTEIKPRYADHSSGFTRITPIGQRKGDNAHIVHIELV